MSCFDFNIDQVYNCQNLPAIETNTFYMAFVKNGMARKAFLKYVESGDLKNVQRQIDKGIVKIVK